MIFVILAEDALHRQLKDNILFQRYIVKLKNVPISATVEFMKIVRIVEPYLPILKSSVYCTRRTGWHCPEYNSAVFDGTIRVRRKACLFSDKENIIFVIVMIVTTWFEQVLSIS